MKPPHEDNEFEAIQMKYVDHTELLRYLTAIDLKLFFGFITIQLALGAFLMNSPGSVEGAAVFLIVIDAVLAVVAIALLRNQFMRRQEVIAVLKNINQILGFDEPGVYHPTVAVNPTTKTRSWFPVYTCGIIAGLIAFSLLALKTERVEQDGADQPATAVDSKSESKENAKPESGVRSQ